MPVSSEEYRDALRFFPSGVTIVTVRCGEKTHGLTVSAFASVSPTPPFVTVIIDHQHTAYQLLERPEAVFAVNFLSEEQQELSNRFAWVKDEDRFAVGNWTTAVTGAPVLTDALAWLDCKIYSRHSVATHTIYVGEVEAASVPDPNARPLLYWNRGYRQLTESPQE